MSIKNLAEKIKDIKIFITDVDGVLTDGRVIYNDNGLEYKFFDVKDGHGLKLLIRYGYKVIFVTGRESKVLLHRAKELNILEVHQRIFNKLELIEKLLRKYNLTFKNLIYCGDDLGDIPVIKRAAIGCTVLDAIEECKNIADYITKKPGGKGAVREICDLILKNSIYWSDIKAKYEI